LSTASDPILKTEWGVEEEKIEFKNKKILLVDDDITYLQAMKRALEASNYEVITASSGEQCFEKLKDQLPDVILLDLRMPEIDGADICRKVRSIRKFQHIPVVMLTASDAQEDVIRSFEAGITDYVIKSGDFKIINLRIYSILRRKHFEEEAQKIRAQLTEAEKQALVANAEKEVEKKFGQELSQKNQALNKEIEAREKIEDELKRSNRDLEQFAYAVSHDLQAPLRQMIAFTSLLNEAYKGRLDVKADEFIVSISGSGQRMQVLIEGLLQYSKIGKVGHETKRMAIQDTVEDALKNLEIFIKENKAKVKYHHLPELEINKTAVTQLFQNLIQNAVKYRNKKKDPVIEISARQRFSRCSKDCIRRANIPALGWAWPCAKNT
jgi:DNA-binding response OmpR family regulator